MKLIQHRHVQRAVRVAAAVGAGAVTLLTLVGIYSHFGLPSGRQLILGSVATIIVGAVSGAVWGRWGRPDVLKVGLSGGITRSAHGLDDRVGASQFVETVEDAGDDGPGALLLEVSSPGGEVTPSADIYHALRDFDGPAVAVVEDVCASGAYLAAAACDRIYAREDSTVGSIGVVGSQVNASDLADEIGIDYEGFTAGEYKDTGHPLKEPSESERSYIQGLINAHYDRFVERVAESRSLDEAAVRGMEARVFDGPDAIEFGLVDAIGDEDDAKEWLLEELDDAPSDHEDLQVEDSTSPAAPALFSPTAAAERVAYAFGRGLGTSIEVSADRLLGRRFR